MTLAPKRFMSNFTSTTTNRGVEAKEIEIANTNLDVQAPGAGGEARVPAPAPPPSRTLAAHDHDDTGSYIQVEVRRARLPAASSPAPAPAPPPPQICAGCERPAPAPAGAATWRAAGDGPPPQLRQPSAEKKQVWRKLSEDVNEYEDDEGEGAVLGPERVEVYYFERGGGAWLAGGAAREARLERWARRAGARGGALLREAAAAPGVLLAAPLAALLAAERALLRCARAAVLGALQTAADQALKPALAVLFNALLQPPLVLAGNVLRALRGALRPLWGALQDATEPAARLLSAARLVQVNIERRCDCQHHV